jgi:hypothetical protein
MPTSELPIRSPNRLSLNDFYGDSKAEASPTQPEPETKEQAAPSTPEQSQTSQNITFQQREIQDIEKIKVLLIQHKTQQEIADNIGCTREAVNRKIAKWSQTDDFREWLTNAWLNQYNEFSLDDETKLEAFKQLTRWMCALTTKKTEVKADVTENIDVNVLSVNTDLARYEAIIKQHEQQNSGATGANTA